MTIRATPQCQGQPWPRSASPEARTDFAPIGRALPPTDPGLADPNSHLSWEVSPAHTLRRCKTSQNLTGAKLPQIRRSLARAWHLTLALRISEAHELVDRIEWQLDDLSSNDAESLRAATQLLRASSLALADDNLAAHAIGLPLLEDNTPSRQRYIASTLCRLGFWKLGNFDAFHALPRHEPGARASKSEAMSAMFDLSIEAAAALDRLQLSTAKRLSCDALMISRTANLAKGPACLPISIAAQTLYEEGCLDEADELLRKHLPIINTQGSIECALRAYLVLARIARHRMGYDLAAILLREGEVLGERRGWPRLVAACLAERVALLLEAGQSKEARLSMENLDRHADSRGFGPRHSCSDIAQYRALARWRVSWAEAPSPQGAAQLRQLYHRALDRQMFYGACRLAVELAQALTSIGEGEQADALFLHTVKLGAGAGLYQVFVEKADAAGALLRRAYDAVEAPGSSDREILPFLGSLLSRWNARHKKQGPTPSTIAVSDALTAREHNILDKVSQGMANKRIARALEISPETVKSHVKRIFLKLAVSTRAEAVSRGKSLGLL